MTMRLELTLRGERIGFQFSNPDGRDHIASYAQGVGLSAYETPLPLLIAALSQGAGVFLDVGANTGLYALLAAASDPKLVVHAFEPLRSIRSRLFRNVMVNPAIAPRVQVQAVALSDTTGSAVFHEHVNPDGFVSTTSTLEAAWETNGLKVIANPVRVDRLDRWLDAYRVGRVGLLKIDVEGHERAVFEGAHARFGRDRPLIIVELLGPSDFPWFSSWLRAFNYRDFALSPQAVRALEQSSFQGDAWNHLFCPEERADDFLQTCVSVGLSIG